MTDPLPALLAELRKQLETYLETPLVKAVEAAFEFSHAAHAGQYRLDGSLYVSHPLAVAKILAEMRLDAPTLMAALLHDVIEDTPITKAQLSEQFSEQVAELVDGVSKLKGIENKTEAKAANFHKMMMATARDPRVILVKLADRLHNMRTLIAKSPESRRRIAKETLEIYSPIATRLGMGLMYRELEDTSFAALRPLCYKILAYHVDKYCSQRKNTIEIALKRRLRQENISAEVLTPSKHLYGVYKKMRKAGGKNCFKKAMSIVAIRVIVENEDACYRALGVVHKLYKPKQDCSFRDYIAIPKTNGYQSLHTTLAAPPEVAVEVKIRTKQMHLFAEYGITTLNLYKTEDSGGALRGANEWLHQLLDLQNNADSATEFLEHIKGDLYPEEIYVFTPQGKIIKLPEGSTALDFAYAVHTNVGNRAVRVTLDDQPASLRTVLQNGQTVEIITEETATPHGEWLNFAKTAKARSNIRAFLKNLQSSQAINLGKEMLNSVLSQHGLSVDQLTSAQQNGLLSTFKYGLMENLLKDIGLGNQLAFNVAQQLIPDSQQGKISSPLEAHYHKPLPIKGTAGMIITLAKCCHPIPGDPIKGYVSPGKGIVVHLESCKNATEHRTPVYNWIHLVWEKEKTGKFLVVIRVTAENRPGVLTVLADTFAKLSINIESIASEEEDGRTLTLRFGIAVNDRAHLASIMRQLHRFEFVSSVHRIYND